MLKRHEVEILLKAGHRKTEVARLTGVSLCSVKRIAQEGPNGCRRVTVPSAVSSSDSTKAREMHESQNRTKPKGAREKAYQR
jgi:hypothetical protein